MRPYWSTVITGIAVVLPYVFATTPVAIKPTLTVDPFADTLIWPTLPWIVLAV